jgi:hypothetical protein
MIKFFSVSSNIYTLLSGQFIFYYILMLLQVRAP